MRFDFCKAEYDYLVEQAGYTDDELKVLSLLRRGWCHEAIATELCYSKRTIVSRVQSIKKKTIKCIGNS